MKIPQKQLHFDRRRGGDKDFQERQKTRTPRIRTHAARRSGIYSEDLFATPVIMRTQRDSHAAMLLAQDEEKHPNNQTNPTSKIETPPRKLRSQRSDKR